MPGVNMPLLVLACVLSALCGYLLGSVSFAVIVSKLFFKEDVRTKGSGNAGMTNILRNYGKKGAVLTLAGDIGKGILAVWCGRWVCLAFFAGEVDYLYGAYIAGIAVILGHMFPLFFKFKGGKGVATSCGVILALQPLLVAVLVAVFLLIVFFSKIVSLASVIGISLYPVVTFIWCYFYTKNAVIFSTVCAFIIAALVVWMHRENIKRLINGTEYKFGSNKASQGEKNQKNGNN